MSSLIYTPGSDLYDGWRTQVLNGPPPKTWPIGAPFGHVDDRPGHDPAARRTARGRQDGADRAVALHVAPAQPRAAGCAGECGDVRYAAARPPARPPVRRAIGPDPASRVRAHGRLQADEGIREIRAVVDRIAFVQGPYDLARVADAADVFEADLLVFDYLQRFDVPGRHNGLREKTNAQMSMLRQFAASGVGIIAAAALTRSKDSAGRRPIAGSTSGLRHFASPRSWSTGVTRPSCSSPTMTTRRRRTSRSSGWRWRTSRAGTGS